MAEIEELKELVAKQSRESVAAQKRVDDLIAELARVRLAGPGPAVHPPPAVNPEVAAEAAAAAVAAARAEKVSKLGIALRKSYKVKEFKDTNEGSVKEWLTRFDQEISSLKKMCGIADDLIRDEIVELFKDKLEYAVVKRLDTAFAAKDAPWTWEEVTYDDLKTIMKEEYGSKIAEVRSF